MANRFTTLTLLSALSLITFGCDDGGSDPTVVDRDGDGIIDAEDEDDDNDGVADDEDNDDDDDGVDDADDDEDEDDVDDDGEDDVDDEDDDNDGENDAGGQRPDRVDHSGRAPTSLSEAPVVHDHAGLAEGEPGEHAERVERDQLRDVAVEHHDQHRRDDGEEHDPCPTPASCARAITAALRRNSRE